MTAATPHTVAMTEAEGGHHGPTLLGLDAEGWVYVGLTIFILLAIFVAKLPKKITEVLDSRIADTRRELDRAYAIRQEAEKLLAEAKARQVASAGDAQAIVAHAEQEAAALIAKAEADAALLVQRRAKMAEDKIAAAERTAVAAVRAKAAETAAKAAAAIISASHGADADKSLVDKTISSLNRLN